MGALAVPWPLLSCWALHAEAPAAATHMFSRILRLKPSGFMDGMMKRCRSFTMRFAWSFVL
jgi:hypothetical protein